jgi:hypothetical protein
MRNVCSASLVCLFMVCGWSVGQLHAQDRPSLVLQGSFGAREDIIESACGSGPQNSFGGSIHYFVTRKTSIGGEVLGFSHCDQTFTFYAPKIGGMFQVTHHFSDGRVRPYVIGGIGFVQHGSLYAPGQAKFDAAGGGGAKIFVSKRIYVAPELQFGTPTIIRYSINLGFILR